ncbi:MAG: hypothetical protein V1801_02350 [Candidatus Falkowbacteria bacterium]
MEMPNLQPIESGPKIKLPEKSVSELEGENFSDYVMEILRKKGEQALANSIEEGKISLGLEAKKAIEAGNQAERSLGDVFDVVDHMTMRAGIVAEELIKKKKEYLH